MLHSSFSYPKVDPTNFGKTGSFPLHEAIVKSFPCFDNQDIRTQLVNFIRGGGGLNEINDEGATLLSLAIGKGLNGVIEVLLDNGADQSVSIKNKKGESSLVIAVRHSNHFAVRRLLACPSMAFMARDDWNDVLCEGISCPDAAVFELLLEAAMKACKSGIDWERLLWTIFAEETGHHMILKCTHRGEILQLLLMNKEAAGLINTPDRRGVTLLFEAARKHDAALLEILLSHGAKASLNCIEPSKGQTPLTVAVSSDRWNAMEIAYLLLAHGADPNQPNGHGETPLLLAFQPNNVKAAKLLMKFGALPSLDKECQRGYSPLSIVAWRPLNIRLFKLLVSRAPLELANYQNGRDTAPLHAAIAYAATDEKWLRAVNRLFGKLSEAELHRGKPPLLVVALEKGNRAIAATYGEQYVAMLSQPGLLAKSLGSHSSQVVSAILASMACHMLQAYDLPREQIGEVKSFMDSLPNQEKDSVRKLAGAYIRNSDGQGNYQVAREYRSHFDDVGYVTYVDYEVKGDFSVRDNIDRLSQALHDFLICVLEN